MKAVTRVSSHGCSFAAGVRCKNEVSSRHDTSRALSRLQALRDNYVPALQRKADSLEADTTHDTQRLEELQADYALLEHELQVSLKLMQFTGQSNGCHFL